MKLSMKKLVATAMLTAVASALSAFAIPIGASKCFPIQHLVNVVAAVTLGPTYGVLAAFCTSVIRNLIGTGTLLAFPGSMVGALLAGLVYNKTHNLFAACIGEVIGTGIIGGMLCYPIATFVLGKEAALFTYVLPFLVSTAGGSIIAAILLFSMEKTGALKYIQQMMGRESKKA
ncbi:MAG: energy coupling factor transporter S component ThiW [Clostridiales bacterium]|nr:energy coupling factor transporter S component ThiW [Clostridiales bacterium]